VNALPHVQQLVLERWQRPHPDFVSGRDPRSSDNALLALFYGSLERAARYDWLNAGRTLIDKTYLRILWTAEGLSTRGLSFDEMASRLDSFIRTALQPDWETWAELPETARRQAAADLVEQARRRIFATDADTGSASALLFFLCPQLPVFPGAVAGPEYEAHLHRNLDWLRLQPCLREIPAPEVHYGQEREQTPIRALLADTDWWPRRLLLMQQRLESVAQD